MLIIQIVLIVSQDSHQWETRLCDHVFVCCACYLFSLLMQQLIGFIWLAIPLFSMMNSLLIELVRDNCTYYIIVRHHMGTCDELLFSTMGCLNGLLERRLLNTLYVDILIGIYWVMWFKQTEIKKIHVMCSCFSILYIPLLYCCYVCAI